MRYFASACLLCALALPAAAQKTAPPKAQKKVGIVNVVLHQFEDGPRIPSGHRFVPGETVFLSFQIRDYTVDEDRKVQLSYKVEAFDPIGVAVEPAYSHSIRSEVFREDKDWMPKARHSVVLPPLGPPGSYRFKFSVQDENNGSVAGGEASFEVSGREVSPSDTLVVRNFRFLRTEDENAEALSADSAYRPGDVVWARFAITGYKLGEKNRLDVEYGLSMLRESGDVVFEEPAAAAEQDEGFYPKRYLPGALSIKLDPDIAPGEYTMVLSIRDKIGGQEHVAKHVFRVQ
jgi:hypothetical protein